MKPALIAAERWFDALASRWESPRTMRAVGTGLAFVFLAALLIIEVNREGWLPDPPASMIATNHFHAVAFAFTLLLFYEVISLVLTLPRSVSASVGKQFEILSLILIRQAFKEFSAFPEPVEWGHVKGAILNMLAVSFGALVIFVILGFYYRLQRHPPITSDAEDTWSFVAVKKMVALCLIALFAAIGLLDVLRAARGLPVYPFFETFYTVLIFSDVLVVLISLRYSTTYLVVFRNSGFAVATVLLRLALTSPHQIKALLGVVAALFALGLSFAYNRFAPGLAQAARAEGPGPRQAP